jgi:phosphoesterase RecJ-like protein
MKKNPAVVRKIIEAIRKSETICIVGHVRPDGDCIGSQLGLGFALKAAGKKVTVWNEDPMPPKLSFLDPSGKFLQAPKAGRTFDCVIATDCATFERLGEAGANIGRRGILINIDHHASNSRYGDLNWVAENEPSTGELIVRLLEEARWPITPGIANCLFAAISTDTGSFQYPSTRPETFAIAARLVERGADLGHVCNEVYHSYSLSRVRLLQHVYNEFKLTADDQVAYFWLRKKDYTRTGAIADDSEGLIDHVRAIQPVVVACLFEEMEPQLTRVSLRSKNGKVNVNEIAKRFGGGGHHAAAGARVRGNPATVQRQILAAVKQALAATRGNAATNAPAPSSKP